MGWFIGHLHLERLGRHYSKPQAIADPFPYEIVCRAAINERPPSVSRSWQKDASFRLLPIQPRHEEKCRGRRCRPGLLRHQPLPLSLTTAIDIGARWRTFCRSRNRGPASGNTASPPTNVVSVVSRLRLRFGTIGFMLGSGFRPTLMALLCRPSWSSHSGQIDCLS